MCRRSIIVASGLLALFVGAPLRASAVIISADQFAIGDGLAQVNALAAPLGIDFDAFHANSFHVALDGSGDKAFAVLPEAARADLLANFARPVDLMRVTFGSIEQTRASYVALHNQHLNPVGPFDGFLDSRIHVGTSDVTLEYVWPMPGTPSELRAALIEQDIAQPHSVYVKSIEVRFISQPLAGDINRDDEVDRTDAALFSRYFGREGGSTWNTGDFNGDTVTSLADFALLQSNLGAPLPAFGAAAVPEPAGWTLALAMAAVAMIIWLSRTARAWLPTRGLPA
jgi:hypothetical protein